MCWGGVPTKMATTKMIRSAMTTFWLPYPLLSQPNDICIKVAHFSCAVFLLLDGKKRCCSRGIKRKVNLVACVCAFLQVRSVSRAEACLFLLVKWSE